MAQIILKEDPATQAVSSAHNRQSARTFTSKTARAESHLVPHARKEPYNQQLHHQQAVEEVHHILKKCTTLNHAVLVVSQRL